MCEYCEQNKKPLFEYYDATVVISNDNQLNITDIYESYYIDYDIEINYCPMCGKKLK